jgi:hypothetical protein
MEEKNGKQPMCSYGKTTKFGGISLVYAILKKKSPSQIVREIGNFK